MQSARGDLEGALAAYDEGLQIARRLLARDPERPEWRDDIAISLFRKAQVAEAAARPADALALWREALATLTPLLTRPSPLPAWQQHASICRDAIARLEAASPSHSA